MVDGEHSVVVGGGDVGAVEALPEQQLPAELALGRSVTCS
jgi:hypothetical protein